MEAPSTDSESHSDMRRSVSSPSLSQYVIPGEAENLASSGVYGIKDMDYQLFLQLPKVCWVTIYKLLDTASLFTCQRVSKPWRNLINQPIVWAERAREEELWMKTNRPTGLFETLPQRIVAGSSDAETETSLTALYEEDPTEIYGPENVAGMKRICKAAFIRRAVQEQHFTPTDQRVLGLLDSAGAADEEHQQAIWREALDIEPCGQIFFDRARQHEQAEQYEASVADYEEAVRLCPYDHNIRTRLGLTYHKQNNLEEALRNYLKTAALCPWYQLAWNNAGSIFFNTGHYEQAEKCFSRCISLDSSASIAFNNRGLCHFLAGDGAAAVKDFTIAYQLNQQDRTARPNRAAALILVGDYTAAVEDCQNELKRMDPRNLKVSSPYLHKHLGVAYKHLGLLDKAVEALELTLELKPDYRQAYDVLAQCLVELDRLNEAKVVTMAAQQHELICGNNETIFQYFLR